MAMAELDSEGFERQVLGSELPVVVDFYADWCVPCRQVAPVLERLAAKWDGRVRFVKVNVDHHPDLAEAYRVSSIPTVLLFVSGHVAGSSLGAKPATGLEHDLGLASLGDQGEPAGTGTGQPTRPGSVRPRWNGG